MANYGKLVEQEAASPIPICFYNCYRTVKHEKRYQEGPARPHTSKRSIYSVCIILHQPPVSRPEQCRSRSAKTAHFHHTTNRVLCRVTRPGTSIYPCPFSTPNTALVNLFFSSVEARRRSSKCALFRYRKSNVDVGRFHVFSSLCSFHKTR